MPAVVQHRSTFTNGATSLALPFSSNNAAGNLLVYCTGGGQAVGVSNNIATDSNTNTIANAINLASAGGTSGSARIDYVASSHSGANTVTAHSTASLDLHIHIWEISGCVTTTPVRATGTADSATASVATSTTTPLTGDAVIAFFYDNPANNALVAGTGYTPSDLSSNTTGGDSAISEYKTATAGGTQTATITGNSTNKVDQVIAVFIQASVAFTWFDMTSGVSQPQLDKIGIVAN